MKSRCAASIVCLLCGLTALAQEPVVMPKSATPSIFIVRKADRKKNEVTFAAIALSLQSAKDEADKNKPPKPPIVRRELQEFTTALIGFEFMTADGKDLSDKAAWDRLKPGIVVIVTTDPKGVDPLFRTVLAPTAIMIVPIGWKEAETEPKGKK